MGQFAVVDDQVIGRRARDRAVDVLVAEFDLTTASQFRNDGRKELTVTAQRVVVVDGE